VEQPQLSLGARLRRHWPQLFGVAAMLGVASAHFLSISWLFAVPRHRREHVAFRLCCDPWAWYTRKLFLRPHIRVIGDEHLPPAWNGYLYVSNHESLVDILLLTTTVRRGFLMKRSVLYSPMGLGTYLSGSVSLDRSSQRDRARALREALDMARRTMSVIVFPEGTYGHADGRLRKPHLNMMRHAWSAGLPVVPLGHAGCRRAVDGQSLPIRRGTELVLVVRPAVEPKDHADATSFAQACWREVVAAVREARAQIPPGPPYLAGP